MSIKNLPLSVNFLVLFVLAFLFTNKVISQNNDDSTKIKKIEKQVKQLKDTLNATRFIFSKIIYNLTSKDTSATSKTSNAEGYLSYIDTLNNNLIELITDSADSTKCNCCSQKLLTSISSISDAQVLSNLICDIEQNHFSSNLEYKKCILKLLKNKLYEFAREHYALYTFSTSHKRLIKSVNINSANDLFKGSLFQSNLDRDYTGGLNIGLTTDYLNLFAGTPVLKSIQSLFFGADVYTPYFQKNKIFVADTSVDSTDRPFASFQYLGYNKQTVFKNWIKWTFDFRLGKIGGNKARALQTGLHQDISYSPRPFGWGAQIANNGRTGISLNIVEEALAIGIDKKGNRLYASSFIDGMFGTYMTYFGAGINLSNKNFEESNAFYNSRHFKGRKTFWKNFLLNYRMTIRKIVHNTMLEGYGWRDTKERDDDVLTPKSRYVLPKDSVQKTVTTLDFLLGYAFRGGSAFYKFSVITPETYLKEHDLYRRRHMWATVGVSFIIW